MKNEDSLTFFESVPKVEIKTTVKRWLILFIYVFYSTINAFQWVEYAIITNIVVKYYNVSVEIANWTSMIFMVLYIALVLPASYIIEKKGLRTAVLLGTLGTMLGTFLKIFSVHPDRFWVVLVGQGTVAVSQLFIFCLAPRIAAVWFKENEVSTACSLGIFGNLLGFALGFAVPPLIVQNSADTKIIGANLDWLCRSLTICMVPPVIAVVFFFPKQPFHPPSVTQAEDRIVERKVTIVSFIGSFRYYFNNKAFIAHTVVNGVMIGVFNALSTMLNQIILYYFKNSEKDAGRMGLTMMIVGIIGSGLIGIILDKTRKYKESALILYFFCCGSVVFLMIALELKSRILVYLAISFFGFCSNTYLPVGFEIAVELVYPLPEGTTTSFLLLPSQLISIIFTICVEKILNAFGPFWALGSQALVLGIGCFSTLLIPNHLRRQEAFKSNQIFVK